MVRGRIPTGGGIIVKDTFGNGEYNGVAEGVETSGDRPSSLELTMG